MSRLHPAFDKRLTDDYDLEDAVMYYPVGKETVEILKVASFDIERRIKEIKSTNGKISRREMNQLNTELYKVNKDIEEIVVRLEAFDIIFDNIDIGAAH